MVGEREQLLPGVWIHFLPRWVAASELVDGAYDNLPVVVPEQEHLERSLASLYPEWHKEAACLGEDEESFFGARDTTERPALSMTAMYEAQQICVGCPVFEQCLTDALVNRNEYGIWAATSGRTRRRIWDAVDAGLTTIPEVIQTYLTGKGNRYDRANAPQMTRRTA